MKTRIPWCHYTVNFWWGCAKISRGCKKCYALTIANRFASDRAAWGPQGRRWIRFNQALGELLDIDKKARKTDGRLRVFVNSMSDTFEDYAVLNEVRCAMFCALEMFPLVDFILLTKRPENIRRMVPPAWLKNWPGNVIIGITAEDQEAWNQRLKFLFDLPAARRMVSIEPMLGEIRLFPKCFTLKRPGSLWIVIGGESGAGARPFDIDLAAEVKAEAERVGALVFTKQLGRRPYTSNANRWEIPESVRLVSDGKTAAGAFLKLRDRDGRDESEWPEGFALKEFPAGGAS